MCQSRRVWHSSFNSPIQASPRVCSISRSSCIFFWCFSTCSIILLGTNLNLEEIGNYPESIAAITFDRNVMSYVLLVTLVTGPLRHYLADPRRLHHSGWRAGRCWTGFDICVWAPSFYIWYHLKAGAKEFHCPAECTLSICLTCNACPRELMGTRSHMVWIKWIVAITDVQQSQISLTRCVRI